MGCGQGLSPRGGRARVQLSRRCAEETGSSLGGVDPGGLRRTARCRRRRPDRRFLRQGRGPVGAPRLHRALHRLCQQGIAEWQIPGYLARRLPSRAGYLRLLLHRLRPAGGPVDGPGGGHGDDEFPRGDARRAELQRDGCGEGRPRGGDPLPRPRPRAGRDPRQRRLSGADPYARRLRRGRLSQADGKERPWRLAPTDRDAGRGGQRRRVPPFGLGFRCDRRSALRRRGVQRRQRRPGRTGRIGFPIPLRAFERDGKRIPVRKRMWG